MTEIDSLYYGMKKEEDLRIASSHQYKESSSILKRANKD